MAAVHGDFLHHTTDTVDGEHAFLGEWLLDRVSGLVDSATAAIYRLHIDAQALHIELKRREDVAGSVLTAELNGEGAELSVAGEKYAAEALLEADALIWELEQQSLHHSKRVRRIMRLSKQGSELVTERVDLNADGMPVALRTEYWTRAGRHHAVPQSVSTQQE